MRKRLKKTEDSTKRVRRLPLTLIVAAVILAVGAVTVISRQMGSAREETNSQASKPSVKSAADKRYVTVKVAGRDVRIDGQTGQVSELTPEEKEKLAAGLRELINQSADGLSQVQQPDGSVTMDLDGHFQNVTVAKINDDGTLSQSCVDNPQAAGEFFGIDPQMIENQPRRGEAGKQRPRNTPVRNQNQ